MPLLCIKVKHFETSVALAWLLQGDDDQEDVVPATQLEDEEDGGPGKESLFGAEATLAGKEGQDSSKAEAEKEAAEEDDEDEVASGHETAALARKLSSSRKPSPQQKAGLPKPKVPYSQQETQDVGSQEEDAEEQSQAASSGQKKQILPASPSSAKLNLTSPFAKTTPPARGKVSPPASVASTTSSAGSKRKARTEDDDVSLTPDTSKLTPAVKKRKKMKGKAKFGKNVTQQEKKAQEEAKYQEGKISFWSVCVCDFYA